MTFFVYAIVPLAALWAPESLRHEPKPPASKALKYCTLYMAGGSAISFYILVKAVHGL